MWLMFGKKGEDNLTFLTCLSIRIVFSLQNVPNVGQKRGEGQFLNCFISLTLEPGPQSARNVLFRHLAG